MPFPGSCILHVAQQMFHVMEGEDICKSHDTVICVSVQKMLLCIPWPFMCLTSVMCNMLVWTCDTCMPDKICWEQNKSRIRSSALYKPSNSSIPFWKGHCPERLNRDVDLCLICFLLFIIGDTSINIALINNLLINNERCHSNSWTIFPGEILLTWETLGKAGLVQCLRHFVATEQEKWTLWLLQQCVSSRAAA